MELCYKCDDKYTRGPLCKNKTLDFIVVDEEIEGELDEPPGDGEEQKGEGELEVMEISIYALMGSNKAKTIRLLGMIKKRKVSILIDSFITSKTYLSYFGRRGKTNW